MLFALALWAAAGAWPAAGAAAEAPACVPPVEVNRAPIVRVEQNAVLVLRDGRAAVLEGLLLPAGVRDRAPDFVAQQAIARLSSLTKGRDVTLRARLPKEDRYGRIRSQVFVPGDGRDVWLQDRMLREGLARVMIAPDRPECARELYAAEDAARAARAGIWALPAYAVRTPGNLGGDLGTFQIVDGVVKNASVHDGRAYLNFGDDWRSDFTATISPDDMKLFRRDGIDPAGYAGKDVEVRGFVQSLNGPEIELADPDMIRVLNSQ
jgi:hypothetical protein